MAQDAQRDDGRRDAQRIALLGMGGTIAGRARTAGDNVGYEAGQIAVTDLVAGLAALDDRELVIEQVAQVNSKDTRLPELQRLVGRVAAHLADPTVRGIVITHGTDTIEETAFVLQALLGPDKPVVLTGAMRPATALSPDGLQNLSDAVAVACFEPARGVVVVCAGQVHAAHDVAKVHPYRIDPFSSGDAGVVACVEEGQVRAFRPWPSGARYAARLDAFMRAAQLPRVAWITSHADAGGWIVQALRQAPAALRPDGLLVAGTGNGSLHADLSEALRLAQADGIRVALATRCGGRVVPHALQRFADVDGLAPAKARWALALELLKA